MVLDYDTVINTLRSPEQLRLDLLKKENPALCDSLKGIFSILPKGKGLVTAGVAAYTQDVDSKPDDIDIQLTTLSQEEWESFRSELINLVQNGTIPLFVDEKNRSTISAEELFPLSMDILPQSLRGDSSFELSFLWGETPIDIHIQNPRDPTTMIEESFKKEIHHVSIDEIDIPIADKKAIGGVYTFMMMMVTSDEIPLDIQEKSLKKRLYSISQMAPNNKAGFIKFLKQGQIFAITSLTELNKTEANGAQMINQMITELQSLSNERFIEFRNKVERGTISRTEIMNPAQTETDDTIIDVSFSVSQEIAA